MMSPKVAPQKNKGMINPPLQPEVTVMAMAKILKIKMAIKNESEKSLIRS